MFLLIMLKWSEKKIGAMNHNLFDSPSPFGNYPSSPSIIDGSSIPKSPMRSQQNIVNASMNFGNVSVLSHLPKIEDLTHGLNEWRNIQSVIRSTFKAFYETIEQQSQQIKNQQDQIRKLEVVLQDQDKILRERSTKAEVSVEINKAVKDIFKLLDSKVSNSDFITALERKASKEDLRVCQFFL